MTNLENLNFLYILFSEIKILFCTLEDILFINHIKKEVTLHIPGKSPYQDLILPAQTYFQSYKWIWMYPSKVLWFLKIKCLYLLKKK